MHSNYLLLEEPIRLASILEVSTPSATTIPCMTKIIGTLGPSTNSKEVLEGLLNAGMTVARFDFSFGDCEYHQAMLDQLRAAMHDTKKLCAFMYDSVGPELSVSNPFSAPIVLSEGDTVVLSPSPSSSCSFHPSGEGNPPTVKGGVVHLPVSHDKLAESVRPGHEIFVGQYLFTGSETTSVWLEVVSTEGSDVVCVVKNSATLSGSLFTCHVTGVRLSIPTLSDRDKKNIATWGVQNNIAFVSLSFTRDAQDVRDTRDFLATLGEISKAHIFAKIEDVQGLCHFDEILEAADGVIISRGNLGLDVAAEKVFLFQKSAIAKCNFAGKTCVLTRVVDTMTDTPRPTRAEATDVANAVLDGCDAILLGAETFRGLYPVESVTTVTRICAESEKVFNYELYFKKVLKRAGEPMDRVESICSAAVRSAEKVRASAIIIFTSTGRAGRLVAKYKPSMPCLSVIIPKLITEQLKWRFTGTFQARHCLLVRGLFPMLADPRRHRDDGASADTNETVLRLAVLKGKELGIMNTHDRVVVLQKLGEDVAVKILEIED